MILLLVLSMMLPSSNIDSVTIAGYYEGCLFITATEAYYYVAVKDHLKLIVVIAIPVKRVAPIYAYSRWYLIVRGHHEYRLVNGIMRLVIVASQYKWLGHWQ